ncbi:SRPBCC family protein [Bacillus sp. T33-2]|uniref:SRPBCC family protein n=1 Tax=Bacillus sp. T33-2 TaxID=2054168 RepID=UPI000C75D55E|nr:SRPBCC domain-containing protein [Bacillus sp. T33-2]PLR96888.1 ATPase [Bacillus sp. T33-2]
MNTASENKVIAKEVIINAPLNLVWHAWTISDRVAEWFAPETVVEPREGGPFELFFVPGNKAGMNTKGCIITKIVPEKELHFTWKGPDQFADFMNQESNLTVVKVKFAGIDEQTGKVSLEHTGFKEGDSWSEAFQWHEMAWSQVLSSLKSALEKGEGNLCCQPVN